MPGLYRALGHAILARGRLAAYRHDAPCLSRLPNLAPSVTDSGDYTPHAEYMAGLQSRLGRETILWARWREVVG
ncbi:MAG: hypothetical protein SF070_02100 [Gemmatimonadota bacterium]|nr:hypothetical protein [Gemmatimonadota bacterium]